MHIGLIGIGKMGQEILNLFFDKGYKISVIGQDVDMSFKDKFEKKLFRQLKKNLITEDEYNKDKLRFEMSTEFEILKDCDLVIEAVYENAELKRGLFKKIEDIVSDKCILASNTSSLPMRLIFEDCKNKERCAGLHFFFPVKLTRAVEINKATTTSSEVIQELKRVVDSIGKQYIVFDEPNNMYLNKVLLILITEAYHLCNTYNISITDMDKIFKDKISLFGIFEIVDSVGLTLIFNSLKEFSSPRYETLFTPFQVKCETIIAAGYGKGKQKGIINYYQEQEENITTGEINEEKIVLDVISVLINEIVYMVQNNNQIQAEVLISAIEDIVGTNKSIKEYIATYGCEDIVNSLSLNYESTKLDIYKPFDLELYKKTFNVEESV